MSVCAYALGSGSSGNATLLMCNEYFMLIDAGIPARRLVEAMKRRGVTPKNLLGIAITHEHDDHIKGLSVLLKGHNCPIIANGPTLSAIQVRTELDQSFELPTSCEQEIGPFRIRSFAVPHDAVEPVGYAIHAGNSKIFYATDLGHVPKAAALEFSDSDLCIIESNYDPEMLRNGPYLPHMKSRVAGNSGHLSNISAAALIVDRMKRGGDCTFWLAHLSGVNNSPHVARNCVQGKLREAKIGTSSVEIALRDRPSVSWQASVNARQLTLF